MKKLVILIYIICILQNAICQYHKEGESEICIPCIILIDGKLMGNLVREANFEYKDTLNDFVNIPVRLDYACLFLSDSDFVKLNDNKCNENIIFTIFFKERKYTMKHVPFYQLLKGADVVLSIDNHKETEEDYQYEWYLNGPIQYFNLKQQRTEIFHKAQTE